MRAAVVMVALVSAVLACKKDRPEQPEAPASLWSYAPEDAAWGLVIQPGAAAAAAEGLQELARLMSVYPVSSGWLFELRQTAFQGGLDPFDRQFFSLAGLDPAGGFALFGDEHGPSLMILAVADRNRFRSYTGMKKTRRKGREIDVDATSACAELRGVYACTDTYETLERAMAPGQDGGIGASVPDVPAGLRGDIEVAIDPGRMGWTDSDPAETGFEPERVFSSLSLTGGGVTMRWFLDGLPPAQLAPIRNLPASEAVADLTRGAVGVVRAGFDPATALDGLPDLGPLDEVSRRLAGNLSGEGVVVTKGSGLAAGMLIIGVEDVEAARALIPAACAAAAATMPDARMHAGACEGTLALPEGAAPGADPFGDALRGAPVSVAVIDDMLVLSIGHTVTGRAVAPPELPAGPWAMSIALRSLDPLATAPEWSALLQEQVQREAGPEIAGMVTAVRWILAHVAELSLGARVVDGGFVMEATALTYGADPPEVLAAYEAAVRKLLANDVDGYLVAMEALAERHDTRAGQQARLVGDRAPMMHPGIALVASAYVLATFAADDAEGDAWAEPD